MMFQPYKGRKIKQYQRIEAYWNLHKGGWSVRDAETKLVLGHVRGNRSTLLISQAAYVVNESGRQRTIREKRKNVHAWVRGLYLGTINKPFVSNRVGVYNPYLGSKFVDKETKQELSGPYQFVALCAKSTHYFKESN